MKFLDKILSDPLGKLLSFTIALFLWYYVTILSIEKTYISLPISLINTPENKIIEYDKDTIIRIEIIARDNVTRLIEKIQAVVDLSNAPSGKNSYPVTLLNLPQEIKANINPSSLDITIYDIITKTISINLCVESNDMLTNTSFSPSKITLKGSSKIINPINIINSIKLIPPITNSNTIETNIGLVIPKELAALSKNNIDVSLFYNSSFISSNIFLPINYIGLDPVFIISNIPATPLTMVSSTSNIEQLLIQSELILDLSLVTNTGMYEAPVLLQAPSNVNVPDLPSFISVQIESNTNISQPLTNQTPLSTND